MFVIRLKFKLYLKAAVLTFPISMQYHTDIINDVITKSETTPSSKSNYMFSLGMHLRWIPAVNRDAEC